MPVSAKITGGVGAKSGKPKHLGFKANAKKKRTEKSELKADSEDVLPLEVKDSFLAPEVYDKGKVSVPKPTQVPDVVYVPKEIWGYGRRD